MIFRPRLTLIGFTRRIIISLKPDREAKALKRIIAERKRIHGRVAQLNAELTALRHKQLGRS